MDGFLDRFNFSQPKETSSKDRDDSQFRRGNRDGSDDPNVPYHDVASLGQINPSHEQLEQNMVNLNDLDNVGTLRAGEEVEVGGANVIIEKFLAEGGNAHVYIAAIMPSSSENPQANPSLPLNRCVLKRIAVPDKASLQPIEKEIDAMKKLQGNPNIVEFYASSIRPLPNALSKGQKGYEAFILMEYCSEGTLVEFMKLREATMFSEPEVLYFFHEICLGVAAMHSQTPKVVHRDLKVENVLITNTQKLKLCDFGSSTTELIAPGAAVSVAQAQVLEDELTACTTLQYRAPEMLDLFQRRGLTEKLGKPMALGVLLYKLCYFKTPFDDESPLAILNCRYTFPSTPVYSHALLTLIKSMLQEIPSSRPPVEKIIIEICRLRGVQPTVSEPAPVEMPVESRPLSSCIQPVTKLTPAAPQPDSLFNPDAITPMRRGRPTRQKPSPANVFVSTSDDPFEMIAAGLDIPKSSATGSPWELADPSPKVSERGSFWNTPPAIKPQEAPRSTNLDPETFTPPLPPPKPRNLKPIISPPPKPPRHQNPSSAAKRQ